jgi:hypothetical protein
MTAAGTRLLSLERVFSRQHHARAQAPCGCGLLSSRARSVTAMPQDSGKGRLVHVAQPKHLDDRRCLHRAALHEQEGA